jgi:hypothetical protein
LPGGIGTALLYSVFDQSQSVMDLTLSNSKDLASNSALRAMVTHAKNDTVIQTSQMREGSQGLTKGLTAALQQIKKAAQLPHDEQLRQIKEMEIEIRNENIEEAITQSV